MKNSYKLATIVLAFVFASYSPSLTPGEFKPILDASKIKKSIIDKAKSTKSIRSDFIQEKHLTMFEEVLMSKGEFLFKSPNKVRWEYTKPIVYIIVLDGKKVLIKDEDKLKAYDMDSNPIFKEVNRLLVHSLNGEILGSSDFRVEYYQSDDRYMARLFPTNDDMKRMINTIEVYFAKIDFGVVGLRINEYSQDFTVIKFQNRVLNEDIKDSSFSLKP